VGSREEKRGLEGRTNGDVSNEERSTRTFSLHSLFDEILVLLILESDTGSSSTTTEPSSTTICKKEDEGRRPNKDGRGTKGRKEDE